LPGVENIYAGSKKPVPVKEAGFKKRYAFSPKNY